MNITPDSSCDVLIIDSGTAGPSFALRLVEHGPVTVLSRGPISEGSTFYAQGGIAAVFDETDSIESHVEDTLIVGVGLCDCHAVAFAASNAKPCVQWLIDQGVLLNTQAQVNGEEGYYLTREGGYSHRCIPHAVDTTGKVIETTLVDKALVHLNIRIIERSNAVDLIVSDKTGLPGTRRVIEAWIWNRNKERVETCNAKTVALATGGAAEVHQYTTNPDVFSGDGAAVVWRADCRVASLEFNQFYPTALCHPQARDLLLTEVLCGEGAHLKRPDGTRSMPDFGEHGELAPHDIVARAIDHEMKRLGIDCMSLDISHKPEVFARQHFPMTYEKLLDSGVDLIKGPVPAVPVAHYTCGGVVVDDNGRTDVDGSYAIGEVNYTRLHGANRMAPNPLLECLIHGWLAAKDITRCPLLVQKVITLPARDENQAETPDELVVVQHNRRELCLLMWGYVDIVCTTRRLERALRCITMLQQELDEYHACFRVSNSLLELRNLVQVAELVVRCMVLRKESRELHYTLDYLQPLSNSGPSILSPLAHIKR